ncbi:hypothetical protein [Mycobacteroides immunogenum]|uniref:Uncharacterized protein n=2 Tax=Mycobacteroides immunogenum TaxID=83262 RepID=A0A7V8RV81_9MYCO|nr:hypothetical protein [Mycobacteroides immunogenum]ANO04279.1 hypothetical protein BAB75_13665 [Mycobacteroides immunogenum]KIU38440.1 hypothetical protein TL11_22225 [Mycobacteroides immunogenum]KPG06881.1 hypothetical protein AN908_19930 [Mycobacteroides immunogenum]KPG18575.1 hypothetical protein AN911_26710 [Mycobacteroides immunogenum]KPG25301.1 hypothetical protein AN913_24485 [Mycobacteroides immunogenum]
MSPYWQSYWYQVMCNEDRNPGWKPLHAGPLDQVPNKSLVTGTLADWVIPVLDDAADEIDWISGEIRIDCYTEAAPIPGIAPFLSSETREVPRISHYRPTSGLNQ